MLRNCLLFDANGGSLRRQEIARELLCKRQRPLSNASISLGMLKGNGGGWSEVVCLYYPIVGCGYRTFESFERSSRGAH